MKVGVLRMGGTVTHIDIDNGGTAGGIKVKDVLDHPESGRAINKSGTLRTAAEREYGTVRGLGQIRVNAKEGTEQSDIRDGDIVMFMPKVEGGL